MDVYKQKWDGVSDLELPYSQVEPLHFYFDGIDKKIKRWKNRWEK